MASTFVQAAGLNPAGALSRDITYGSNVTANNLLLLYVLVNSSGPTTQVNSVTDSIGNTWTQADNRTSANGHVQIFWAKNLSTAANTVTAHFNNALATFQILIVCEYTNPAASPIDGVTVFTDSTGTSYTGTPIISTQTNETIVALGYINASQALSLTGTGGFTTRFFGSPFFGIMDAPATSPGTYTPTATVGSAAEVAFSTVALFSATSHGKVATPTFSPVAGAYGPSQSVTVSSTDSGAAGFAMYYTTDGSTPTTGSTLYSGPVAVSVSETLKVLAVATGFINSDIASAAYTINGFVATPTFSPVAGTYASTQSVTISSVTAGASIFYTTDGSTPTSGSTPYSGPVSVSSSLTLKAIATKTNFSDSAVGSAAYVISSSTTAYSVPDCRVPPAGPNASRTVQGTKIYDVQTSSNSAIPPKDSRAAGAPVDSRVSPNIPQNSRTPGTFGPGE
jgi:hypothetical protein